MKIGIVLGTRPEIIKLSSLIRLLQDQRQDFFIAHTNQHYSANMDAIFFKELQLPSPKYNLGIGSGGHGAQTGKMLIALEEVFVTEKPDVVFVQGDTNSVLAGALAAAKMGIKVAHVEAGLRSYDRSMPEEINRIIVDHMSGYCFAPTKSEANILRDEGVEPEKVFVVGNTIVDAVMSNSKLADPSAQDIAKKGPYILITLHRPSNADDPKRLSLVLETLRSISKESNLRLVLPIHPRTAKNIEQFKLSLDDFEVLEPQGYLSFLTLEKEAAIIVTDSGGIQEEACILQVPCLTLRPNTERPDTVRVGANALGGETSVEIKKNFLKMRKVRPGWENPYGDGSTARQMLAAVTGEAVSRSPKTKSEKKR